MVRNVFVEESVRKYVARYVKTHTLLVGLIIGVTGKTEDYVVRLIRCIPEDQESDEISDESLFNGEWLGGMAVEVSHMLPGGLQVIGLFSICSSENEKDLNKSFHKCNEVLKNSKNQILKKYGFKFTGTSSWVLAQFDIQTAQCISCTHHEITGNLLTCQWVYQSNRVEWGYFHTYFQLDEILKYPSKDLNQHQQMQTYIHPSCLKISAASILFDNKMFQDDVVIENMKKEVSLFQKISRTVSCTCIQTCPKAPSNQNELPYGKRLPSMQLNGGIFSCAYLPITATVKEATTALKHDAICSLYHRSYLLADLLEEENCSLDSGAFGCFPRRLGFTESGGSEHFLFCDYAFVDESKDIIVQRIEESFDIQVRPDMLKSDLEKIPIDFKLHPLIKKRISTIDKASIEQRRSLSSKSSSFIKVDYKNRLNPYSTLMGGFLFFLVTCGFAFLALYVDGVLFPSDDDNPSWSRSMLYGIGNSLLSLFTGEWLPSLEDWL